MFASCAATLSVARTRSGTASVRTRIEIFGGRWPGTSDPQLFRRTPSSTPLKLRETPPVRTAPETRSGAATLDVDGPPGASDVDVQPLRDEIAC